MIRRRQPAAPAEVGCPPSLPQAPPSHTPHMPADLGHCHVVGSRGELQVLQLRALRQQRNGSGFSRPPAFGCLLLLLLLLLLGCRAAQRQATGSACACACQRLLPLPPRSLLCCGLFGDGSSCCCCCCCRSNSQCRCCSCRRLSRVGPTATRGHGGGGSGWHHPLRLLGGTPHCSVASWLPRSSLNTQDS